MVFPVAIYGCESWAIKKAEHRRTKAFELRCWRRLLRVPWTARRSNQPILKEINPEYSVEGLMLKLKFQYFGQWLIWKDPDAGKDWRWKEKGTAEDEMVEWHHWFNDMSLGKFWESMMDRKAWRAMVHGVSESDRTEWLNWTENNVRGWIVYPSPQIQVQIPVPQRVTWFGSRALANVTKRS